LGIGFTALSNGFATCDDPDRLQQLCDQLGPEQIQAFFQRWLAVIPTPLTAADRTAGYWWELSMRQVEVSRTLVFNPDSTDARFCCAIWSAPDRIAGWNAAGQRCVPWQATHSGCNWARRAVGAVCGHAAAGPEAGVVGRDRGAVR
jgi:hypothetical protein